MDTIKNFIKWEKSILKISSILGVVFGLVIFVLGNTIGQFVSNDSVDGMEAIWYLVAGTIGTFLLFSLINIICHSYYWLKNYGSQNK